MRTNQKPTRSMDWTKEITNMTNRTIGSRFLRLLACLALVAPSTLAPAQTLVSGTADITQIGASPSASGSMINNYLYQDEQINLDPNAGNVRRFPAFLFQAGS